MLLCFLEFCRMAKTITWGGKILNIEKIVALSRCAEVAVSWRCLFLCQACFMKRNIYYCFSHSYSIFPFIFPMNIFSTILGV